MRVDGCLLCRIESVLHSTRWMSVGEELCKCTSTFRLEEKKSYLASFYLENKNLSRAASSKKSERDRVRQ
jgi:hypothetical protein